MNAKTKVDVQRSSKPRATSNKKAASKAPVVLVMGHVNRQIRDAGGDAREVSYTSETAAKAIRGGKVHALLLTGGSDISPELYGAKPHAATGDAWVERDLAEVLALEAAMERGIPVLGICRGSQMLNAVAGGTLNQHVPAEVKSNVHQGSTMAVRAAKGSRLAKAFGNRERQALHLHHQAVAKVAPGFVATGWAHDGVVECIESVEGWMMGVQFHPEMRDYAGMQEIFDLFVAAAAKHAGLPTPKRSTSTRYAAKQAPQKKGYTAPKYVVHHVPKPARTRKDRLQTWDSPVLTSWRCFRCGVDFDERADHIDHMLFLHGVDVMGDHEARPDNLGVGGRLQDDDDLDYMWEGVE